jgi:hypothetical protein
MIPCRSVFAVESEHISPPNSPEPTQLQPEHNTIGSNMQSDLLSWW